MWKRKKRDKNSFSTAHNSDIANEQGHETPQIEVPNAHDNAVWDLAWHPAGYILCSGSNDHTTKFWCRNRPVDTGRDKFNAGYNQGYGEQNPAFANRAAGNFTIQEQPTTPGPFPPGLSRNEGTIPGVGAAMPLSIPSVDNSSHGEQKQAHPPPLPPGPHPSMMPPNQPQSYQHNPQQIPQQGILQQMPNFPQPPPNMPQLQPPSHMPLHPHHHIHRPPPQMPPHNRPPPQMPPHNNPFFNAWIHADATYIISNANAWSYDFLKGIGLHDYLGMQNATNQMVPQMQQGYYMGMNPMQSGPMPSGGMPPSGGFSNGMPNMQGPPSTSGPQMYPPAGAFNRPQGGQMPMMPGLGPYQELTNLVAAKCKIFFCN
uniref:Uncharacterized protein n=1 Tax=Chenopodium quinoa TaxID=63459 RepID=A0A803MYB2_CHEQI